MLEVFLSFERKKNKKEEEKENKKIMKSLTWSLGENIKRCKGSWRALGLEVSMNGTNIQQYFYYINILTFGFIEILKKFKFEFLKLIFKVSIILLYILKWKNYKFQYN